MLAGPREGTLSNRLAGHEKREVLGKGKALDRELARYHLGKGPGSGVSRRVPGIFQGPGLKDGGGGGGGGD